MTPYKEKQNKERVTSKKVLIEHFCLPAVKDMMAQKHSSTSIALAFLPELSGSTWQKISSWIILVYWTSFVPCIRVIFMETLLKLQGCNREQPLCFNFLSDRKESLTASGLLFCTAASIMHVWEQRRRDTPMSDQRQQSSSPGMGNQF